MAQGHAKFLWLQFGAICITIWYSKIYLIAISDAISAEISEVAKQIRQIQKQCYNIIVALLLSAAKAL